MKKRVLMIADADGYWTVKYIERLLLPQGYEVVLFPIWGNQGTNDRFYQDNAVTVYKDNHRLPIIRYIPRLRLWVRISLNARSLFALGPFDIIHNLYLSQRDLALGRALQRRFGGAKWVCTFLGSDMLRSTSLHNQRMKRCLKRCDAVTIVSPHLLDTIRQQYGDTVLQKTKPVYFGQTIYEDIDRARMEADQKVCKSHFGIDPSHKVICVGHNASPAQRQPEILHALGQLPTEEQREITVVLPMTYCANNPAYVTAVKEAAKELSCDTILLTDFLDETENAYLRLCADVFILAIQTDAFSGSLREYLYSGAHVLLGDWLHYPPLTALGIETRAFSDFHQITGLVQEVLWVPISEEEKLRRAKLRDNYSWETVAIDWLKLYS